ncbi:MAG: DUF488 family protein [Deltaproteobacteria bacterium]|nr:DUF488 family protein [Deltaproteobacteria bacterium]
MAIQLQRIYDPPPHKPGFRVLVDRLWPRGINKQTAALDLWCRGLGPSDALRAWFGHDPEKWEEFQRRYFSELEANQEQAEVLESLAEEARQREVIFLFAAKDVLHNNAVALKAYLEAHGS